MKTTAESKDVPAANASLNAPPDTLSRGAVLWTMTVPG